MSFEWLNKFLKETNKATDYAEKSLASYKLGMRAKGSIAGVQILVDDEGCQAAQQLDPERIYHPDEAPHVPLPECDRGAQCHCIYRPVMSYQLEAEENDLAVDSGVE